MRIASIISALIVILAPAFIIAYDSIVWAWFGYEATITAVVRRWSTNYTELPYAVGGLFVWLWLHLFFDVLIKR